MAFTQDDLAAIDEALSSGALEVQFADGKRVRYRGVAELLRAKAAIEAAIAKAEGRRPLRGVRMNVTKGI